MSPDMDLLERMKKGISVLNKKYTITVPRIIDSWEFMSPSFLQDLASIYDDKKRFIPVTSMTDFGQHLGMCSKHGNHYYVKFDKCPICFDAKLQTPPTKQVTTGSIPTFIVFHGADVYSMISDKLYFDINRYIVHVKTGKKAIHNFGCKVYFTDDGNQIDVEAEEISFGNTKLPKQNKTRAIVKDKKIYYVTPSLDLVEATINKGGVGVKQIARVAINNLFEINDAGEYFICNQYDHKPIFNINGHFYEHSMPIDAVNYGIHFDQVSKRWLFVYEDKRGTFWTNVFENNSLIFTDNTLKYDVPLESIMYKNNTIFTAHKGLIRGFNWKKNEYKDFGCSIVEEGALLRASGNKIIIINEKEVYEAG
jgi:hypothetical protein